MCTTRARSVCRTHYALLLLALGACGPSLRDHVSAVGTLAQVRRLPALREGQVAESPADEVRTILRAPIDANAAVRIALLNNRELRAKLRELGIVAGQVVQAGLMANPLVDIELVPERDSKLELRVEYDLTSIIMAPLRRQAMQYDLEAARLDAAGSVVQLGYEVRTRFYAFSAALQQLTLAKQSLDALAASRDAAQALLEAGNTNELAASSQIAAYERARVSVAKLELSVAEQREQMQRLLGLHGEQTEWSAQPNLEGAPDQLSVADDLERRALEANLDLRASHKRLSGLAKQTGVARTAVWLPDVTADVHALQTKVESDRSKDHWRAAGGFSVVVPLFDRGQGHISALEAQFDALLERYQGLAIATRSAARDARNRLVSAHARAHQYQTVILPAQTKVMEQSVLQYNAMQLGVFQLLQARQELLDVQLSYVDTLREYWSAVAELEALTQGRIVHGSTSESAPMIGTSNLQRGGH